jgi:hypothetical protein
MIKKTLFLAVILMMSLTFVYSADSSKWVSAGGSSNPCPEYNSYTECMTNCLAGNDPCGTYLGSCDYYCKSLFVETEEDVGYDRDIYSNCATPCKDNQIQMPYPDCSCLDVPSCGSLPRGTFKTGDDSGLISTKGTVLIAHGDSWCFVSPMDSDFMLPEESTIIVMGGSATIRFMNGVRMDVSEGTQFSVISPRIQPDGSVLMMVESVFTGIYRYLIPEDRYGKFEVQQDSVLVGITGTEFVIEKKEDNSLTIDVLKGIVEVSKVGRSELIELKAGESIDLDETFSNIYRRFYIEEWWNEEEKYIDYENIELPDLDFSDMDMPEMNIDVKICTILPLLLVGLFFVQLNYKRII